MLAEFKKSVSLIIEKFPQYKEDIQASYQLALDEIEDGGSISHEISICLSDIDQIINNS